jgi:hypothetical protein
MNETNTSLQQQLDSRCPCFALPLEECRCEFNDDETESDSDSDTDICVICNMAISPSTMYRAYGCSLCRDCFKSEMY